MATMLRVPNTQELAPVSSPAIKDVMRRGRSNTTKRVIPGYTTNLAKAVLSRGENPHSQCVEKVELLVRDLAGRGALNEALEIGREYMAIAREEYRKRFDIPQPTFAEAHDAEQRTQGAKEVAEVAVAREVATYGKATLGTITAYLAASSAHQEAEEIMDDIIRGMRTEGT